MAIPGKNENEKKEQGKDYLPAMASLDSLVPYAREIADDLYSTLCEVDKTFADAVMLKLVERYYSIFCDYVKDAAECSDETFDDALRAVYWGFIECSSSWCNEDFGVSADHFMDGIDDEAKHLGLKGIALGTVPDNDSTDARVRLVVQTLRLYNQGLRA